MCPLIYLFLNLFFSPNNIATIAGEIPNMQNSLDHTIYPLPYFSPFQVLIENGNNSYCGGTIISNVKILTILECVPNDLRNLKITAGVRNLSELWESTRFPIQITNNITKKHGLVLLDVERIRFNIIASDIDMLMDVIPEMSCNDFLPGVPSWGATFTNSDNIMRVYPFQVIEWKDCGVLSEFEDYNGHNTFCAICTYNKSLCGIELGDAFVVTDKKISEFFLYGISCKIQAEQDQLYVAFINILKYRHSILSCC